jgi:multidrug efflux system outer membrane protein
MDYLQRPFIVFMCLLSGCTIHRVDEEAQLLEVEIPPSYSESTIETVQSSDWNYSWWETFEDKDLNDLIETGLSASFGLRQYVARIEQATALARQAGARLYPSIDLDGGYALEWDGETGSGETRDLQGTSDLGFLLSWELYI